MKLHLFRSLSTFALASLLASCASTPGNFTYSVPNQPRTIGLRLGRKF